MQSGRGMPGEAELAGRIRELAESRREAESLVAPLDDAAFQWRPASDAWSVGHCLEHLVETNRRYLEVLDEALRDGTRGEPRAEGPFRYGLPSRWVAASMEPPPKLRIPAPRSFIPPPEPASPDEVLDAFRSVGRELAERIRSADGLDLARVKVRSPAIPLLRFPLGIAFAVITAHERRHLWQARRVVEAPGFPRRPSPSAPEG